MAWRKSSRCAGNGACVEVAYSASRAMLRDSRKHLSPILVLSSSDWASFLKAVKHHG